MLIHNTSQQLSSVVRMLYMLEPPIQQAPDFNFHQMPILKMCFPLTQLFLSRLGARSTL